MSTVISIDEVHPGMTLAEDAVHVGGRVLLRAGTQLTEKHIHIFKTWGLTEAAVEGVTQEEPSHGHPGSLDPAILKAIEDELGLAFQHADLAHPAVSELYRLCTLHFSEVKIKGTCDGMDA